MFKKDRLQKLAGLLKEGKDLQECGCEEESDLHPELHDDRVNVENDDEGAMAKGQLELVKNHAEALLDKMPDEAKLDGWVQSKITIASDLLDSVAHYLQDEVPEEDAHEVEHGPEPLEAELEEMDLSLDEDASGVDKVQYKKWREQLKDVFHSMKRAGVQPSDHLAHAIINLDNRLESLFEDLDLQLEEKDSLTDEVRKELKKRLSKPDAEVFIRDEKGGYYVVTPEGLDDDDEVFVWATDEDGEEHKVPYASLEIMI